MKSFSLSLLFLLVLKNHTQAYDRKVWTNYPNMNFVTSLAEGNSKIYVATTGGIRRYDRFRNQWLSPLTTIDGLPNNHIQKLTFDPKTGDLWFDTPTGSARWISRLEKVSFAGQNPGFPHNLLPSIPNVFPPFGYFLENRWIRGPHQNYAITDVLIDTWNILWTGTWGLGIGRADLRNELLEFHHFGPLDQNVTAIARDGDKIWFGAENTAGTPTQGLTRYYPSSEKWEYFEADKIIGIDNPQVSTILPDSTNVWFGTRNGLIRYTKKEQRWITYRISSKKIKPVTALALDHDRLWIGTESGLAVLDLRVDTIRTVTGSENFTIRALATGPNYVWAGTNFGLYCCPRRNVTWSAVQQGEKGITKNPISSLTIRENDVWATVETPPGLIFRQGLEDSWKEYPLSEITGSRRVTIAVDNNRVWLGTDLGVYRLNLTSQLWKSFNRSNGLLHNQVQAICIEGGYVWFGTAQGISRFHWAADFFENDL